LTRDETIRRLTDALNVQTARANRLESELADSRCVVARLQQELRYGEDLAEFHAHERASEDFWTQREATGR
jgi:hypothetical protein